MQYDVDLVHEIESLIGKQLDEYELEEEEVLKGITKVRVLLPRSVFYLKLFFDHNISVTERVLKSRFSKPNDWLHNKCKTVGSRIWSRIEERRKGRCSRRTLV